MSTLIIKYGFDIEESRLTKHQKQLLESDDYFIKAALSIGSGKDVIVQAGKGEKAIEEQFEELKEA